MFIDGASRPTSPAEREQILRQMLKDAFEDMRQAADLCQPEARTVLLGNIEVAESAAAALIEMRHG